MEGRSVAVQKHTHRQQPYKEDKSLCSLRDGVTKNSKIHYIGIEESRNIRKNTGHSWGPDTVVCMDTVLLQLHRHPLLYHLHYMCKGNKRDSRSILRYTYNQRQSIFSING